MSQVGSSELEIDISGLIDVNNNQEEECSCSGSVVRIFHYVSDIAYVVKVLKDHNLIFKLKLCSRCGREALLDTRKWLWRCQKKFAVGKNKAVPCNTAHSAFKGGWLERAHISPQDSLVFTTIYLDESYKISFVQRELGWARQTIVDWASFHREVIEDHLVKNCKKLGGVGFTVEIDESKFGKRKYHRGKRVKGQWVFGGICRETNEIFAEPVPKRDAATLLDVIKKWIHPGTTIISDCWKAYDCLESEGYKHFKVNHSVTFKDPVTGAHTNRIERLWRSYKANVPRYGRAPEHFTGYLARYYFMRKYPTLKERVHAFLLAAAQLYPPQ